jgi:oligosaccharide repeat unit polymerase
MRFDYNGLILIANFLIYLSWFLKEYLAKKRITPYSFMVLWYSFIALMAWISYSLGIYSMVYMGGKTVKIPPIDPTGLILVFISFYIFLYPLKKISIIKIQDYKNSKILVLFETICALVTFTLCLLYIPFTLKAITIDAVDLYTQGREDGLKLMPHFMYLLTTLFRLLYLFFLPYCLFKIRNRIAKKYVIYLIAIFIAMLQLSIISASRGALFLTVGTFVFMYVLFSPLFNSKVKKVLNFWLLINFSAAGILGIGITFSRSEAASFTAFENIVGYFGESFNHFCFRIWDNHSINRTYGEVYFPQTYSYINNKIIPNLDTRQEIVDYWEFKSKTGNHNNFSPMYGKLYMEFGWLIPMIIMSAISLIISKYFVSRSFKLSQLPLLGFLFINIYFYSIFTNTFRENIFRELIYVMILCIFVKIIIKIKAKYN